MTGVLDGTPFEVEYLVSSESQPQADALAIQEMLGKCGIRTKIIAQQPGEFLAPGPDGPVFGRSFELAQFAWATSLEPPCNLYLSSEIPGPYPEFPKGWGGVNASGYTNPEYDQACDNALFSLPDSTQHRPEHFQAQQIFSEDLPGLPLYLHYNCDCSSTRHVQLYFRIGNRQSIMEPGDAGLWLFSLILDRLAFYRYILCASGLFFILDKYMKGGGYSVHDEMIYQYRVKIVLNQSNYLFGGEIC